MQPWVCDTDPSEKYRLWSRANAGEVMPDPVSPLSATLSMFNAGEAGWRDAYIESGAMDASEFEDFTTNTIGCFGGYMYLNMSLTRIYGVRMPGMTPEIVDFTYFGEMPGIPPYQSEARPTDDSPRHTAKLERYLYERVFGRTSVPELDADRAYVQRLVEGRPELSALGDADLVIQLRSLIPAYRHLFGRHIQVSGATGLGNGTVAGVMDAIGRPELGMTLIAGLGDVDSAAPSSAMFELSRLVNDSPALTEVFDGGARGLAERLVGLDGDGTVEAFRRRFAEFLERFGSRGPNEWELLSHTWGTRPELALALIDRMRGVPDEQSPAVNNAQRAAEREAATAEVTATLAGNDEALGQFLAGLGAAQVFNVARERSKTSCILLVHEMRLAARELGRRLVERGIFDTVEQVFMVTDGELDQVASDPAPFAEVVRQREVQYRELFDVEPPFVFEYAPPSVSDWPRRSELTVDAAAVGDTLSGIPGCPGRVTGTARVILDPSDPGALGPGEILVAPVTDPAWTPLFVPAAAVVVDVGAQLTHAVIVSRELGIPCVVSVTGATRKIPDGATITVDGAVGTVTIDSLTSA
jgi:rifampicin phosphotransferase